MISFNVRFSSVVSIKRYVVFKRSYTSVPFRVCVLKGDTLLTAP